MQCTLCWSSWNWRHFYSQQCNVCCVVALGVEDISIPGNAIQTLLWLLQTMVDVLSPGVVDMDSRLRSECDPFLPQTCHTTDTYSLSVASVSVAVPSVFIVSVSVTVPSVLPVWVLLFSQYSLSVWVLLFTQYCQCECCCSLSIHCQCEFCCSLSTG